MGTLVISDVHGASEPLRRAGEKATSLLVLGDLVNLIDYMSMSGILVDVFSREAVAEVVELRTAGRLDEARAVMAARSAGREEEIRTQIVGRVEAQYEEVFDAMPPGTYLILGNVDHPRSAAVHAERRGVILADGRSFEIEGERFGFVGGALPTPMRVSGEVSEEDMRASIDALGEVDVLCSHIPPDVPELCWDTVAGRGERGSADLLEYLMDVKPRRHYFGHVHQPLVSSMQVGETRCINVGYFRRTERAFPHVRG